MDIAALKDIDLFEGLTEDELRAICELGRVDPYPQGTLVFEEDSDGTEVFIVLSGRVGIELTLTSSSRPEVIHTVRARDIFGELALIDGHRRSAAARALGETELLVLPRAALKDHLKANEHVGLVVMSNLARILSTRLRKTDLSLRDVLSQQQVIFKALA